MQGKGGVASSAANQSSQNDEELTRLMTSPVRAKMQIQSMKLGSAGDMSGQSAKGGSQGSAQQAQHPDGHYLAASSWQGKQLP